MWIFWTFNWKDKCGQIPKLGNVNCAVEVGINVALPLVTCGESKWSFVTRLGIIPVTSPQPRGIIIPIVSENLPFKVKRKALLMPSGQNDRHSQRFLLKRKALSMPSGQKKGIGNGFTSKVLIIILKKCSKSVLKQKLKKYC